MSNWCCRSMASLSCRFSATCICRQLIADIHYLQSTLLPASNCTFFSSSWDAMLCRVEMGAHSLPVSCWNIWRWSHSSVCRLCYQWKRPHHNPLPPTNTSMWWFWQVLGIPMCNFVAFPPSEVTWLPTLSHLTCYALLRHTNQFLWWPQPMERQESLLPVRTSVSLVLGLVLNNSFGCN